MMSVLQLRMLIRIDECRLAHYQQMVDHASEDSTGEGMNCARGLRERWSLALQRLQFRRAQLAGIAERRRTQEISPTAPPLGHVVPSNDTAQPANPS